jgi:hypothetical protein
MSRGIFRPKTEDVRGEWRKLHLNFIFYLFISIPLIPYFYGDEVFIFFFFGSYIIGRIPWTSDRLVARLLPKDNTTQIQNNDTHTKHPCAKLDSSHYHCLRASEDSSCLTLLCYRNRPILITIINLRIEMSETYICTYVFCAWEDHKCIRNFSKNMK